MSDLRDEIARAFIRREWDLGPGDDDWNPAPEELAAADAVLRVVESRLLSDEAVSGLLGHERMEGGPYMASVRDFTREQVMAGELRAADEEAECKNREYARELLSAAWRVVTGSNHE